MSREKVTERQNAESVGNALKTTGMRIRGSVAELEEAGEEVDELVQSTSKMRDEIKGLSGVDIMESDGETYRSTYNILVDIAKVWDKLSDVNQATLLEDLAGKRNATVVKSIITNINDLTGSYETAHNALGAIDKANTDYLDSIQGRFAQFSSKYQEFSNQVLNSETIKFFVSIGTSLIGVLQKILTFGDGIILKIGTIIAVCTVGDALKIPGLFHSIANSQMITTLTTKGLTVAMLDLNSRGFIGLITAIPKLIAFIISLVQTEGLATLKTFSLSAALKALNISPIVLAISALAVAGFALVKIWDACTTTTEEYAEKLEKSSNELQDINSKIQSLNSELQTTKERIIELQSKDALTVVEQAELDKLKETNAELEKQIALQKQEKITKGLEVSSNFAKTVNTWRTSPTVGEFGNQTTGGSILVANGSSFNNKIDALTYWYSKYKEAKKELLEGINLDVKSKTSTLFGEVEGQTKREILENEIDTSYQQLKSMYSTLSKYKEQLEGIEYSYLTKEAQEAYDYIFDFENKLMLMSGNADDIQTVFDSIYHADKYTSGKKALEEFAKTNELTADKIQKSYSDNSAVRQMLNYMGELGLIDLSNPQQAFEQFTNLLNVSSEEIENAVNTNTKSFENLNKAIDDIQTAYDTVTNAIKEYNETGYLSADNLQKLLELDDKYLQTLIDENGQLNINADAYKKLMLAELEELELQQVSSVLDSVDALTLESAQVYATKQAIEDETASRKDAIQVLLQEAIARAALKDASENTTVYTDALKASIPNLANRLALIRQTEKAINSGAKSSTDALEAEKKALEKQKKVWEDKLDDLEDAKSDIQDLIDLVTDMITKEKELEKEVLEKQKDDFDELIDKRKELLELQREEIKNNKELADKQNTVSQNALAASIAQLDDSGAGKKSQKEANIALRESRSDLQEHLIDQEYEARINSLDKFKEATDKHYDEQIEAIDEYLSNERQLYEDACTAIDNDNGELYSKLLNYVRQYTTQTDSEFQYLWANATKAIETYGSKNIDLFHLMDGLNSQIYNVQSTIDTLNNSIDNTSEAIEMTANAIGNTFANGISNAKVSLEEYKDALAEIQSAFDSKWVYEWQGTPYYSMLEDKNAAIQDILNQIGKDNGGRHPASATTIYGTIKPYATGTTSANGGLSLVGEDGAELRVLNKGDGIIPTSITKNLMAIGKNPKQYFHQVLSALSSDIMINDTLQTIFGKTFPLAIRNSVEKASQNISPTIQIIIQGDATQSTVKALRAEADNIVKRATNNVMNIALRNKSII